MLMSDASPSLNLRSFIKLLVSLFSSLISFGMVIIKNGTKIMKQMLIHAKVKKYPYKLYSTEPITGPKPIPIPDTDS